MPAQYDSQSAGAGSHASPAPSKSKSLWPAFGKSTQLSEPSGTPSPSESPLPAAGEGVAEGVGAAVGLGVGEGVACGLAAGVAVAEADAVGEGAGDASDAVGGVAVAEGEPRGAVGVGTGAVWLPAPAGDAFAAVLDDTKRNPVAGPWAYEGVGLDAGDAGGAVEAVEAISGVGEEVPSAAAGRGWMQPATRSNNEKMPMRKACPTSVTRRAARTQRRRLPRD